MLALSPSPDTSLTVRPVSTHEATFLAAACVAFGIGLLWLSQYGIDPIDEGYFAHLSQRMAAGEAIYCDFPVPYTPGAFALHAGIFRLFGVNLWLLRLPLIGVRMGLVILLYLLGRRVMPPLWAAIAPAALLLQDPTPGVWDPHPAWYAAFVYLGGVWAVLRGIEEQQQRWWLIGGVLAGLTFLFKQNLGLFLSMTLAWLALFDDTITGRPGKPLLAVRIAFLVLVSAAFVVMTLPFFSPEVALIIIGPLLGTALAFGVNPTLREQGVAWSALVKRGLLSAIGFASLAIPTVLWLGLTAGFESIPLAAYIGSLDQKGFFVPLPPLNSGNAAVLIALLLFGLGAAALTSRAPAIRVGVPMTTFPSALLALALGVSLGFPDFGFARNLVDATQDLVLFAMPLAGYVATGLLVARPSVAGQAPTKTVSALLVAGALLWFNQYPRMDVPHALWSGLLLWVVGAFLLWECLAKVRRISGQRTMPLAAFLLLVPAVLLYPRAYERAQEFLEWQPAPPFVALKPTLLVGVPSAPFEAQADLAYGLWLLSARVQDLTEQGEPVFVFPASPILYVLADRPNATPYGHIFPGLISSADEQRLIADLERRKTHLVIRDTIGMSEFLPPTELTEFQSYIEHHYRPLEEIGRYQLLVRR